MGYWSGPAVHGVLIAQGAAWLCLLWIMLHLGKHLKAPLGFHRAQVFFSWGQKDQLKATGLLTLISYLIPALPQVYTPANRPDIRISSFVLARGFGPPQGFEVCVSACHRWARVSIIWLLFPFTPDQLVRMKNRPRRGEGTHTCPAQQADVLWGSLWVAARERGQTDVKHTLVLQVVTFASCLLLPLELCPTCCSCLDYLPTVTSVLRWKQNLNVNILADWQNEQTDECLSLCGNHPSNERLPCHIVCRRNDRF